jgi:uncharacterized protein (TIGR02284 family)
MAHQLDEKLTALRDRLHDALDGYAQALKSVDDPDLHALFEEAVSDKARSLSALAPLLPEGEDERGGSLIGTFTRGIVAVRSAITGDQSLLPGMVDGEERVSDAYRDALAAAAGQPEANAVLADLHRRQEAFLATLRTTRDARA